MELLTAEPKYLIWGTGIGNLGFYAMEYLHLDADTAQYLINNTLPLSSVTLSTLGETGLIGLTLVLVFQLYLISDGLRLCKKSRDQNVRTLLLVLVVGCTGCCVQDMFSGSPFSYLLFGLLGGTCYGLRSNLVLASRRPPQYVLC